jgi:serine protease Do
VAAVAAWECLIKDHVTLVGHKGVSRAVEDKKQEEPEQKPADEKKPDGHDEAPAVKAADEVKVKEEEKKEPAQEQKVDSEAPVINFEKGFEDVAKGAMNSVVNVATMQLIEDSGGMGFPDLFGDSPFDDLFKDFFDLPKRKPQPRKAHALGSGFVVRVDKDTAFVVTNNHVVSNARKIVVILSDKKELNAQLYASDPRTDIAVLSVDLKGLDMNSVKMQPIEWGDSDRLNEGNYVLAIGNPFGLGSTVTHGIVSAKGRNVSIGNSGGGSTLVEEFIQHSAPINMGNSGGCLLNTGGKVIGINTAIYSPNGGSVGLGFAIPSKLARPIVEKLIAGKTISRGWLGVEVQPVTTKQAESVGLAEKGILDPSRVFGAFVAKTVPDGPAAKAGIKAGDIIIGVNGTRITEHNQLPALIGNAEIGKRTALQVWRRGQDGKWAEVQVDVVVGDYEEAMADGAIEQSGSGKEKRKAREDREVHIERVGITVGTVPARLRGEYPEYVKVVVIDCKESPNAFHSLALMPGDGILTVNGVEITSPTQAKSIIEAIWNDPNNVGRAIPIVILRHGAMVMIAITVEPAEPDADQGEKKTERKRK